MTASGRFFLAALTLLGSFGYAAHAAAGLLAPAEQNRLASQLEKRPMVFFLAKGPPDACGPGCSEWIAAEGKFVPGTAQRFRDLVATISEKNPPVFFHSPGGVGSDALEIGFIMRERRMTAGIGRTVPERCRVFSKDDVACQRLISSGGEVKAQLLSREGQCHSACVFAFAGASVRHVPPGAKLGVHSVRVDMTLKKQLMRSMSDVPKPTVADAHLVVERYFAEMGVDPRIVAIGAKVDSRRMYVLSRDEIASAGLETRGFYETPWIAFADSPKQRRVLKSITLTTDGDRKEFRTVGVHIRCFGNQTSLLYLREVPASEVGLASSIRVTAGESERGLYRGQKKENGRELWWVPAGEEFLRSVAAASSLMVTEALVPGNAQQGPQAIKLSSTGLAKPLETLLEDCRLPKWPDVAGGERKP